MLIRRRVPPITGWCESGHHARCPRWMREGHPKLPDLICSCPCHAARRRSR